MDYGSSIEIPEGIAATLNEPITHFNGLEAVLKAAGNYLTKGVFEEVEEVTRRSISMYAKHFVVWNQKLFRRTLKGIRAIPTKIERLVIIWMSMMTLVTEVSLLRDSSSEIASGGRAYKVIYTFM